MKLLKKILLAFSFLLFTSSVIGYFYFDKKFTPKPNNLNVVGESSEIPILWIRTKSSDISALLLKVKIAGINDDFYMQFDTGSPNTIFYKNALNSIQKLYGGLSISEDSSSVDLKFSLGEMDVTADDFLIYNAQKNWSSQDSIKLIGTIGTDLMEKRTTRFDFKNSEVSFSTNRLESSNSDFKFQKRRILIPVKVADKQVGVIYDSGTSGFEYITNKDIWENLKLQDNKIDSANSNSMGKILKTYTTVSNKEIQFENDAIKLNEVTYIEGYSSFQYLMMKFSGMGGMLGNKLFIDKTVIFDCRNEKYSIE